MLPSVLRGRAIEQLSPLGDKEPWRSGECKIRIAWEAPMGVCFDAHYLPIATIACLPRHKRGNFPYDATGGESDEDSKWHCSRTADAVCGDGR